MKKLLFLLIIPVLLITVIIPIQAQQEEETNDVIPSWVKGILLDLWADNSISDEAFIQVLTHLIESEIIVIDGYGKINEEYIISTSYIENTLTKEVSVEESTSQPQLSSSTVITVEIDKTEYSINDKILISGEVRDLYSGIPVSIIIKTDNNELISISQVTIDDDKKYNDEITIEGNLWVSGEYTIEVQYGSVNRMTSTIFSIN